MTVLRLAPSAVPARFGARRSLREEITETLRAAIISGELRPGVVYSVPSLADKFGVSATPVEAGDGAGAEALMERHIRHVRGIWVGSRG